jgi:hypothetical protein
MPFKSKAQQVGLLPQVGSGPICGHWIVSPQSNDSITWIAKKASNFLRDVAMVYAELRNSAKADGASIMLRSLQFRIIAFRDSVSFKSMIARFPITLGPARLAIPRSRIVVIGSSAITAMPGWFRFSNQSTLDGSTCSARLTPSIFSFACIEPIKVLVYLTLRTDHKVLCHAIC